jgi:hypothetical protein
LLVAALVVGACGGDNDAADEGPPSTQPRVLGGQIPAPDRLTLFCQASRNLTATLRAQPIDSDQLGEQLGAYLASAPDEVKPQVENVVGLFIYRTLTPTLGQDAQAIRRFKAENCAQAIP